MALLADEYSGVIVVGVRVDREGKGGRGQIPLRAAERCRPDDGARRRLGKQAAMASRFSVDANARAEQMGTITSTGLSDPIPAAVNTVPHIFISLSNPETMHTNALRSPKLTTLVAAHSGRVPTGMRSRPMLCARLPMPAILERYRYQFSGMWVMTYVGHHNAHEGETIWAICEQCSTTATISTGPAAADPCRNSALSGLKSHWQLRRPLVKITSCRILHRFHWTHSVPYLVPEAADAIHEIGRRFTDSVVARGGSRYRIRITSVTRTPETVRRPRRRNVNVLTRLVGASTSPPLSMCHMPASFLMPTTSGPFGR